MSNGHNNKTLTKRNNYAKVTLAISKYGPISRVHLAKVVGMSMSAISGFVDYLLARGVLVETDTVCGNRGRPMTLLDINPDGDPIASIWIGPEEINVAVASSAGEILARRTMQYSSSDDDPNDVVKAIARSVQQCAQAAEKGKTLKGIGVTVAGLADPMLGVIDNLTNRRGWDNFPIVRSLSELLSMPVYLESDVRAAALASQLLSEGCDGNGVVYLLVSEGVGAAVVHNQELVRGMHDAAGLLGHTTLDPDGPPCGCGNCGCLEALASDKAFIDNIWPNKAAGQGEMRTKEREKLVRRGLGMALGGDDVAIRALHTVTKYIGIGVANAICTLDPKTVYIGGTLMDASPDYIIDLVRREALRRVWTRSRGVEIKALSNHMEFLLKGGIGLVLWQPYKALQEESNNVHVLTRTKRL